MSFVHLRTKTDASLKEGLNDYEALVAQAKKNGHTSLALTDLGTLSQAVGFYTECKKQGIKPIIGIDAEVETDLTDPGAKKYSRLLLLAKNNSGYKKIMELVTRSNVENYQNDKPLIKESWLKDLAKGDLVALSGTPRHSILPRIVCDPDLSLQQISQKITPMLAVYKDIFGEDFFLEVSRNASPGEDVWVERMVQLSQATKIPLVATHDVLFAEREDFFAHEVHSSITQKTAVTDPDYVPTATREQYYTSTEEMNDLFSDIPQALENADFVAKKCNAEINFGVNHLPNYPVPAGKTIDEVFAEEARAGLKKRLEKLFPDPVERKEKTAIYEARLEEEIGIILGMKFPGYFLVVSDFIRWSKAQGIPVGPGRGSGAGSLVAYSLLITDIDPIEHSLLFERFLNPERVSMPDIDIDFCRDRRDETIHYIFEKYGADAVSQISTFSTLAAKAAIRHVGKVLNYPLPLVDEVARMIPNVVDISIKDSIEQEEKLKNVYENDKRIKRLLNMALKIEGSALTTGVHAGGVVIAPGRIDDFSPMMRAAGKDVMVTQFDKDDVEKAGLIKFDLLGLKTLTHIQQTVDLVNARPDMKDKPIVLEDISLNDPDAISLLRDAQTYGVFQLVSSGMQGLLKSLKPDNFEDIVAVLALYRPGPMKSGMVDNFVARKHGQAPIDYYHPSLEEILKPTYGVIVYQEQVMQIAQIIAGYTLGGADLLRRAMGKKKPEEMAKERVKFEEGAAKNGIDPKLATSLFDAMEKFAEYGFNRSHSAAYAVLSIQTAYFKKKFPTEFFAAYMNVEVSATDTLAKAVIDARASGIDFILPDINTGCEVFVPRGDKIEYSFSALKGTSASTISDIVACRKVKGNFETFKDFLYKMNDFLREQGRNMQMKQTAEALIKAGAFDKMNTNRAELMASLKEELEYIGKLNRREASKTAQTGPVLLPALWNKVGIVPKPAPIKQKKNQKPLEDPGVPDPSTYKNWSDLEKLQNEAKSLGFYLSSHPYATHAAMFDGAKASYPLSKIDSYEGYDHVLLTGVIDDLRTINAKNGNKMAFMMLSDGETKTDIAVFSEALAASGKKLKVGEFIGVEASIRPSKRKDKVKDIAVQQIFSKPELLSLLAENVHIACTKAELADIQRLQSEHAGNQVGTFVYMPDGADRLFKAHLPEVKWKDTPECLNTIQDNFTGRVKFDFREKINFENPYKNKFQKSKYPNSRKP